MTPIITGYHPGAPTEMRYSAIEPDWYDGAPDTVGRSALIGWGRTPEAAQADLHEKIADVEESVPQERGNP